MVQYFNFLAAFLFELVTVNIMASPSKIFPVVDIVTLKQGDIGYAIFIFLF